MRVIDNMRKPFAVRDALSNTMQMCVLNVLKPDQRKDDNILQNEVDFEPLSVPKDNFA